MPLSVDVELMLEEGSGEIAGIGPPPPPPPVPAELLRGESEGTMSEMEGSAVVSVFAAPLIIIPVAPVTVDELEPSDANEPLDTAAPREPCPLPLPPNLGLAVAEGAKRFEGICECCSMRHEPYGEPGRLCRHTLPSEHRKPVMFTHSFRWSYRVNNVKSKF